MKNLKKSILTLILGMLVAGAGILAGFYYSPTSSDVDLLNSTKNEMPQFELLNLSKVIYLVFSR